MRKLENRRRASFAPVEIICSMASRARATLIMLTYNQEPFVAASLNSALAQTHEGLQVIVSDDCSLDGTYRVVEQIVAGYRGHHRVCVRRNEQNLGISGNLASALRDADGDLIVFAPGDDISRPDRVSTLVAAWEQLGSRSAVLYSDYLPMDADGRLLPKQDHCIFEGPHRLEDMANGVLQVLGATSAITADLVADFPPILPTAVYEDRIYPFRALLKGGTIIFVKDPLVTYRLHVGVSQKRADDAKAYITEHSQKLEKQKLGDAVQRLYDLYYQRPEDTALRRACERTILTHETRIAFSHGTLGSYERLGLVALFSGASKRVAAKLYIKHRLFPLMRHFIKI